MSSHLSSTSNISVVIVNLNGGSFISDCIDSIDLNLVKELIIVDNGSTDNSIEIISSKYPFALILNNSTNLGFAGPANQGAAAATGKYILFLNNDLRIIGDSLQRLVSSMVDIKVAAIAPRVIDNNGGLDSAGSFLTSTGFLHHTVDDDLEIISGKVERFSLKGACLLVRRSYFVDVGGFDASFFAYFEETDLCWRFISHGYSLIHDDKAIAIHDGGRTTKNIFDSSYIDYLSFRNRITSIRKNASCSLKWRILPIHIGCCLIISLAFFLMGKRKNATAILKAIHWHFVHLSDFKDTSVTISVKSSWKELKHVTVPFRPYKSLKFVRRYLLRW